MNAARYAPTLVAALALSAMIATTSSATLITLSPNDVHGGDSSTASFSDGSVTLTPLIGATPATFNNNPSRLGIDDQGTNAQAFNDPDTDPNNGNEEKLQFEFTSTAGLSQIGWDFSRADGSTMDDGVTITGFSQDPVATFSGRTMNGAFSLSATYDDLTGSLFFSLPFEVAFAGEQGFLDLARPSASAGQTLLLTTTDTDEAGAQLAIRSISYTVIPEPTAAAIALMVAAISFAKRRV